MFIIRTGGTKAVCLICSETVAVIKSGDVKRHTKHDFKANTPLSILN